MASGYIRFFAQTDGGAISKHALEYCRSLIRIAPVRLVSVSGPLAPEWRIFERLLSTDQSQAMIANVVCTDPSQWIRTLSIPMPKENPITKVIAGQDVHAEATAERAKGDVELYTSGQRNVLILASDVRSEPHRRAGERYEAIIQPKAFAGGLAGYTIPTPVTDHSLVRWLVSPAPHLTPARSPNG